MEEGCEKNESDAMGQGVGGGDRRNEAESCRRSNEGLMSRKGGIEAGMMGNVLL